MKPKVTQVDFFPGGGGFDAHLSIDLDHTDQPGVPLPDPETVPPEFLTALRDWLEPRLDPEAAA